MKTASVLIIGNEILTGKIADTNSKFVIDTFYRWGVRLRRVVVVPDIEAEIVDELRRLRLGVDIVITSGGIGPTHDDITLEAIAVALGRTLVESTELRSLFLSWNKDPDADVLRKMTHVPEGSQLTFDPLVPWPLIRVENVVILPGVPSLFEKKLLALEPELRGDPFIYRRLRVLARESAIARLLIETTEAVGVDIGSYPRHAEGERFVWVTFESQNPALVEAGLLDLESRLRAAGIEHRRDDVAP